jgi:hypothetical protein
VACFSVPLVVSASWPYCLDIAYLTDRSMIVDDSFVMLSFAALIILSFFLLR